MPYYPTCGEGLGVEWSSGAGHNLRRSGERGQDPCAKQEPIPLIHTVDAFVVSPQELCKEYGEEGSWGQLAAQAPLIQTMFS